TRPDSRRRIEVDAHDGSRQLGIGRVEIRERSLVAQQEEASEAVAAHVERVEVRLRRTEASGAVGDLRACLSLALATDARRALEARSAVDAVAVRETEIARARAVVRRLADARGAVDGDPLSVRQEPERSRTERTRNRVGEEERLAREGGPGGIAAHAVREELYGVDVRGTGDGDHLGGVVPDRGGCEADRDWGALSRAEGQLG